MKARFAALATLLLGSCYYGAPDSVLYGNPVATVYASGVDWNTYTTFSVDPTVAVVDGTGSVTTNCSVDGTQLVPTIVNEMTARGYTQVAWTGNSTGSDLQIKMNAALGSQDVYYPGYCGWYPYYYCYPGWVYAGSYSFGTLVIDMGDAKNALPAGKIPLVWNAIAYGVLSSNYTGCSGSGININWPKLQGIISQAFDQSPYIQKTP